MSTATTAAAGRSPRVWGLLAEFETVEALIAAAERVRRAGFTRFDAHSPVPVHGIDEAMDISMSKLPWVVAAGGAAGALGGLLLQWWTNAHDYPLLVSGKPLFGLPAAIPVTFELTVLLGALGAIGGLIFVTGFPRLHHPLFASARFRRATADRFFLSIEAADPRFELAPGVLEEAGAVHVEEIAEEGHRAPGSGHRGGGDETE